MWGALRIWPRLLKGVLRLPPRCFLFVAGGNMSDEHDKGMPCMPPTTPPLPPRHLVDPEFHLKCDDFRVRFSNVIFYEKTHVHHFMCVFLMYHNKENILAINSLHINHLPLNKLTSKSENLSVRCPISVFNGAIIFFKSS